MRFSFINFLMLIAAFSCQGVFCSKLEVFRFASHYESHMVLQQAPHRAVLWGFGEINQSVLVHLDSVKVYQTETYESSDGSILWKVELDPMPHGGPHNIIAHSLVNNVGVDIAIHDVLFGNVWFCGGQSNMVFTMSMGLEGAKEIANADNYPNIRLFTVKRYYSQTPLIELEDENILQHWSNASKGSVGGAAWQYFSAVCWMYGRKLYDLYGVPVGLISSNFGGTCAEAWSSHDALKVCNLEKDGHWNKLEDQNSYTVLWNAMIRPFINTTIYGAIWYQGERNALINPEKYNCTFPAMIADWRKKWHEGTGENTEPVFPFGFVQLAPLGKDGKRDFYAFIRWQQTAGYGYVPNPAQPNVFMAVAMDLPDDDSPYGTIHPRDKTTVADRLILGARAIVHGENINFQGPIIDTCTMIHTSAGEEMINITYRNVSSAGILLKSQKGFEVSTMDSPTTWTAVNIDHATKYSVFIKPPALREIVAVRYAWAQQPCDYKQCAIYSADDDLPAPPFFCQIMK